MKSKILLFADDSKISKPIESDKDISDFQDDINNLVVWTDTWKLSLNPQKCKILHLGRKNPNHTYYMDDDGSRVELQVVSMEKDLGVIIDDKLNFEVHIGQMVNKANRVLGLIRRKLRYLNNDLFFKLIQDPGSSYSGVCKSSMVPNSCEGY